MQYDPDMFERDLFRAKKELFWNEKALEREIKSIKEQSEK